MPIKIKIFISFLGLVAVVLVYLGLKNLNIQTPDSNFSNINSSLERDDDWDNDGLSNKEESYWNTDPNNPDTDGDGYLDGEEVASGHDPLIPAPNDKIARNNLTESLSQIALAGLAEGSLKPGSPNYVQALNLIADEAISLSEKNLSLKEEVSIRVVPDNQDTFEIYLGETAPLIEKIMEKESENIIRLTELVDDTNFFDESKLNPEEKSFQNLSNFAHLRVVGLNSDISTLQSQAVPQSVSEQYKFLVKSLKEVSVSYSYLIKPDSDPIQAMLAFRKIIFTFIDELPKGLEKYGSLTQKL